MVCRLENAPLAVEKEARLLLFQDLEDGGFDNLSCLERLSRAQLSSRSQAPQGAGGSTVYYKA